MKNFLILCAILVLSASAALATGDVAAKQTTGDLVTLLPASEGVATVNFKKLLNEVLPDILASQPAKLAEMNAKLAEIKAKTGVDLRQFEQAAMGFNYTQIRPGVRTVEPIALLRGNFTAAGLIAAGKIAANGKFRQETIGGKLVTIFTLPAKPKASAGKKDKMDDFFDSLSSGEISVTAFDANTLAFGKPAQVRSLLTAKPTTTSANADFAAFAVRKPDALMNFGGNVPAWAIGSLNVGNDQIGGILKSLRQVYTSVDYNGGSTSLLMLARTALAPQAQELEETLMGLQMLGKNIFSGKSDAQSQALSELIESVKVTRTAADVQVQFDITNETAGKLMKAFDKKTPAAQPVN